MVILRLSYFFEKPMRKALLGLSLAASSQLGACASFEPLPVSPYISATQVQLQGDIKHVYDEHTCKELWIGGPDFINGDRIMLDYLPKTECQDTLREVIELGKQMNHYTYVTGAMKDRIGIKQKCEDEYSDCSLAALSAATDGYKGDDLNDRWPGYWRAITDCHEATTICYATAYSNQKSNKKNSTQP